MRRFHNGELWGFLQVACICFFRSRSDRVVQAAWTSGEAQNALRTGQRSQEWFDSFGRGDTLRGFGPGIARSIQARTEAGRAHKGARQQRMLPEV